MEANERFTENDNIDYSKPFGPDGSMHKEIRPPDDDTPMELGMQFNVFLDDVDEVVIGKIGYISRDWRGPYAILSYTPPLNSWGGIRKAVPKGEQEEN